MYMWLVTQSRPTLATPWTVAWQAPLSIGFSRQEHWSGLPFPSPGHPPNPANEPRSPALQADSLPTEMLGAHHSRMWCLVDFLRFSIYDNQSKQLAHF